MSPAEQNPATNPLQATSPEKDAAAGNAGPAKPSISAYPKRRSHKRWIFLVSIIALVVAGAFLWHYLSGFESTDDAQVDVHLYPVSARISGYIQKVNVEDNQWVDEGATLVEIDPKDYEVALARAQAAFDTSEATANSSNIDVPISSVDTASLLKSTSSDIKNAEAAIHAAEKRVAADHARILEAQAENVKAQDDVTRYHLLLAKEEVPKQVYDHAYATAAADVAAVAAAEADEAAAEQAVLEAHSRLTEAEAHYEDAQAGPQRVASTRAKALSAIADAHQKRAAVEQAQLNLGYTKIFAPVAGEVTKKVVVGLNVDPGEQMLTVVPLDQVWVTANFKETQLKHMRVGQKARIELDSNGRTYDGHVDSIAGGTGPIFSLLPPENATGNYVKIVQRVPVKIVLEPGENSDRQLRPGMNIEAKVYLR
ncbi:membrane fusion protein (multidrug efflux system) [Silvibacterium bohemicum]|uniref:Membrane fusion protein (Multidrug efflux system) n=1 Tax=Silvibacterium bohemicum TaxID=1577686 RepID=A0A841JZR6_9BACT|nr:HlyD family secretion protein [Silvibacterium bohemicum]MBB6145867.1 membrane fusion protein (multidrug efflux system) [Silvibacterium bohemicum]